MQMGDKGCVKGAGHIYQACTAQPLKPKQSNSMDRERLVACTSRLPNLYSPRYHLLPSTILGQGSFHFNPTKTKGFI